MRGFHERDFVGIKKYTLDASPYENVPPFVAIYHDRVDFIDERISRTKFLWGKNIYIPDTSPSKNVPPFDAENYVDFTNKI